MLATENITIVPGLSPDTIPNSESSPLPSPASIDYFHFIVSPPSPTPSNHSPIHYTDTAFQENVAFKFESIDAARNAWKFLFDSIIGYKEMSKKERTRVSEGARELWKAIPNEIRDVPYEDPRNGAVVLYEERFEQQDGDSQPWWARGVGFRVLESTTTVAATLPIDVLLLIRDSAMGSDQTSKDDITFFALVCRSWVVRRQQLLFSSVERTRPVQGADAKRYVALVAKYAERWQLCQTEAGSPPGWCHRYLSLYSAAARRQLPTKELETEVKLKIDLLATLAQFGRPRCRSIFSLCPKSLPPSCTPTLRSLSLNHYRFHLFSDLMHIVWELPTLQSLYCKDVYWEEFGVFRPPTHRVQSMNTFELEASCCTDEACFVLLVTSLFRVRIGDDTGTLPPNAGGMFLLGLLDSLFGAGVSKLDFIPSENNYRVKIVGNNSLCRISSRRQSLITCLEFTLIKGLEDDASISAIHIISQSPDQLEECRWNGIGKHLLFLLHNNNDLVKISFIDDPPPPVTECIAATTDATSQMHDLWDRGRLRFQRAKGRWDEMAATWSEVCDVEGVVPEPYTDDDWDVVVLPDNIFPDSHGAVDMLPLPYGFIPTTYHRFAPSEVVYSAPFIHPEYAKSLGLP